MTRLASVLCFLCPSIAIGAITVEWDAPEDALGLVRYDVCLATSNTWGSCVLTHTTTNRSHTFSVSHGAYFIGVMPVFADGTNGVPVFTSRVNVLGSAYIVVGETLQTSEDAAGPWRDLAHVWLVIPERINGKAFYRSMSISQTNTPGPAMVPGVPSLGENH